MNRIVRVLAPLLATACGGTDSASPPAEVDHHEEMVIESIPYDALGQSRIVFHRSSNNPPGSAGMVILDGRTRTATKHISHTANWDIDASPDGSRVVYLELPVVTTQRNLEVNISKLDSTGHTELGGPGGFRRYPSWTPDGSAVVYTESDDIEDTPPVRIVSQEPFAGSPRHVLWEKSGICETAEAPRANAAGDIVFILATSAGSPCSFDQVHIARKKPGQPPELLYGFGPSFFAPAWSPTGAEIAFFALRAASRTAILVDLIAMNADGSNVSTLASGLESYSSNFSLCWGADGSTLFFSLANAPTESHIYAIAAVGGMPVPITTQPGAADLHVSCPR